MSKEAEVNMMLYKGLQPQEENKLKRIENDVVKLVLEKGDNRRPMWTSTSITNNRFLQLVVQETSQPEVLFELSEEQLANLSESDIVSQIKNGMG